MFFVTLFVHKESLPFLFRSLPTRIKNYCHSVNTSTFHFLVRIIIKELGSLDGNKIFHINHFIIISLAIKNQKTRLVFAVNTPPHQTTTTNNQASQILSACSPYIRGIYDIYRRNVL